MRLGQRFVQLFTFFCMFRPLHCFAVRRKYSAAQRIDQTRIFNNLDDLMNDVLSGRLQSRTASNTASSAEISSQWRRINWKEEEQKHDSDPQSTTPPPSPVDTLMIRDRIVYLKRDDQLVVPGSRIAGNKARKMLSLQRLEPERFPAAVVSYGGPQSNAMLSLAAVVHYKNEQLGTTATTDPKRKRFVYYTKTLPRFLKSQPSGNLFRATALGMELIELSPSDYNNLFGSEWGGKDEPPVNLLPPVEHDSVWIPQGGACSMAEAGTKLLAKEIYTYWSDLSGTNEQPLAVVIPGGTCSTAALVHQALQQLKAVDNARKPLDIKVVVVPCVGDDAYARRQMMNILDAAQTTTTWPSTNDDLPGILMPSPNGKASTISNDYFPFAEPNASILSTFQEFRDEHNIVLDLLYGAPAWTILLRHWTSPSLATPKAESCPLDGRRIMYVHSGGLEGINTQLLRYKYKNLIDVNEIQLPGRSRS